MSEQDGNTAVGKESVSADAPQPASTPQGAVEESYSDIDWEEEAPAPATIAALEFQVAWLLNDQHSTLNWNGKEVVVNEPGGLAKKYEALRGVARVKFPARGDLDDVLNQTIDDYKLGAWANPVGFWTAFKRDMLDAEKAAFEAKRAYLEKVVSGSSDGTRRGCNAHVWAPSPDAIESGQVAARKWLCSEAAEIHAPEPPLLQKWQAARTSDNANDRLICEAIQRVMADDEYMDELAHARRDAAKLARFVAEIRSLAGCSQAEAYRLLAKFKERHTKGQR